MKLLSIDLGVSGAAALWEGPEVAWLRDLPVSAGRIAAPVLTEWVVEADRVIVERVHAMPQVGSKASFSMGHHLGLVTGVCGTLGRPLIEVAPTKWKKALGLGRDKDAAREMACRLFPDQAELMTRKKDHNRAEALLIGYAYIERGIQ